MAQKKNVLILFY